jgi:O-antigen/teichoic acid export membrane protein
MFYAVLLTQWPKYTEFITEKRFDAVDSVTRKIILGGLCFIFISTIAIWIFKDLVTLLLTDSKLVIQDRTIYAFGIYYCLRIFGDTYAVIISSVNKIGIFLIYMPFQAAISVLSQVYLAKYYGAAGIVLGIAASFLVTATWINAWHYLKIRKTSIKTR